MADSTAGLSHSDFQMILDKVHDALKRIGSKVDDLFRTVNGVLSKIPAVLIPDGLVQQVRSLLQRVNNLVNKFISKVMEYLNSPGLPSVLRETGDKWASGVGGKARTTGDDVSTNSMKVGVYWRGNAALAYRDTLDRQKPACDAMSALTRDINESLGEAASAIEEFWQSVAIAAVVLAGAVIACIGACVTGIGTPAGLLALIGGIIGAITAIAAGYNSAENQYTIVTDAISTLKDEMSQNSTLNGGWPAATAEGEWTAD